MRYDPYIEAEYKNIYVYEANLDIADGFYQRTNKGAVALINKHLTEAGKRSALTHELMHHEYSAGTSTKAKTFHEKLCRSKHEKFIDRKAAEKLMPLEDIRQFLKNTPEATVYELADFFSVTERFMRIRIELLISEGGL